MKFFGGFALLSLLIVVGVVAIGQDKATRNALKERPVSPVVQLRPAGSGHTGTSPQTKAKSQGTPRESSIGRALDSGAIQAIAQMLESARLNYLSDPSATTASLKAGMAQDVPGMKVTLSPQQGALYLVRLGPSHLALCTDAGGPWHCFAENLQTGQKADAFANSLRGAVLKSKALVP